MSSSSEHRQHQQGSSVILEGLNHFAGKALLWTAVYMVGKSKSSALWLAVPLSFHCLWKLYKNNNKSKAGTTTTREQALVSDIPRWVYFPDSERAEWINKIVRQLWPAVQVLYGKITSNSSWKHTIFRATSLRGWKSWTCCRG